MDTLCVRLILIRGLTLFSRHHSPSLSIVDEFNTWLGTGIQDLYSMQLTAPPTIHKLLFVNLCNFNRSRETCRSWLGPSVYFEVYNYEGNLIYKVQGPSGYPCECTRDKVAAFKVLVLWKSSTVSNVTPLYLNKYFFSRGWTYAWLHIIWQRFRIGALCSSLSYNKENRFSRFRPWCLMSQTNMSTIVKLSMAM